MSCLHVCKWTQGASCYSFSSVKLVCCIQAGKAGLALSSISVPGLWVREKGSWLCFFFLTNLFILLIVSRPAGTTYMLSVVIGNASVVILLIRFIGCLVTADECGWFSASSAQDAGLRQMVGRKGGGIAVRVNNSPLPHTGEICAWVNLRYADLF